MTIKLDLKNKIINGSLDYWQRGTSFAAIANNTYHADRFHYIKTGAMVHTISRSTDEPASAFGVYSMFVDCTTVDSSIAAGDYAGVLQHIEGNVLRSFKGKKMVLTFWVKATKTGTYCVALRNGTSTRAYIMEYTVSASNTWEKKTLRFAHDVTGTWSYDNGIGLTAVWTLACGSTYQTSANAWVSGNFLATANQVNACDNVANDFYLSDICMVEDNEGQTRDPEFQLAGRDIFEELQLCQRYYEKSYDVGVAPGTITNIGAFQSRYILTTNADFVNIKITPKRGLPIVTPYNPETGVVNSHRNTSTNANLAASANTGFIGLFSIMISVSTSTATNGYSVHWTADAEL